MNLRRALVVVVVAAAGSAACASEAEPPKGASPAQEDPKVTEVREACSSFATRLCESATSCCESTTGAFSVETCAADFVHEVCGPAAALVGEGIATYHPDSEDACVDAYARAHATCTADWDELLAIRRDVWASCKIVLGTYEAGRGCSISSECAQPEGPSVARCLPDPLTRTPTCQVLELLAEGAECPFPQGDVSVCDVGLYCTTHALGVPGVCERIAPEGGACDPSVALNSECGLGNYCGRDDSLCHHATNFGGPSCAQDAECVSLACQMSSNGGSCIAPLSTAADLCARGA